MALWIRHWLRSWIPELQTLPQLFDLTFTKSHDFKCIFFFPFVA